MIDLEPVHGKPLQVAQAGITRTEIVDRQAHADLGEPGQRDDDFLRPLHRRRFRNFQFQETGIQFRVAKDLFDAFQQILLPELARGQIHGDLDRHKSGVLPRTVLPARRLEHPFADGDDQAGLFRERNEAIGRDQPQFVALPADQGFGADDPASSDIHLGLISQNKLPAFERAPQLGLQTQFLRGLGVDGVGINLVVISPFLLGVVHRDVRVFQQIVDAVRACCREGDAHTPRQIDFLSRGVQRLRKDLQNFVGDRRHLFGPDGAFDEEGEFVPGQAGDGVDVTQILFETRRHLDQDLVADRMPEIVIDVLEPVEVEEHHRDKMAFAPGVHDRPLQTVAK